MTSDSPGPGSGTTEVRSHGGPVRLAVLAVLGAVLIAALVLSIVGLTSRSDPGFGLQGAPAKVQREREDVMAQAEQFMLRINTYGPDLLQGTTMPRYRDLVTEVITPKFGTDFEKNVPAAEATVAQGGLARTTTVLNTAVSTLDADSATALVAGSFTNSYPEKSGSTTRVSAAPSPFRVQIDLVKIKGMWLVDNFTPVTGLPKDTQSQAPLDPSSIPSFDSSTLPSLDPVPTPSTVATP